MPRAIKTIAALPTLEKPKRVAAYARVSNGKDAMMHSLSAQVSYYSSLIQNHPGWQYAGVFADEAQTGTKEERTEFQRLLTECRSGRIDIIICKSISRMARNTVTLLNSVRELRTLGVDVFFEEQNIHTMSSDGELMLTILASYAQEESRSASENQKWRVRKGFEQGELLNWRFMLGYNITKDGIAVNPEEAEIIREVYRRFVDGESMNSIAADLNDRGITGVFDGRWTPQRLRQLLSNEKYTGNALLWKHYRNNHIEKKKTVNRGELPMFYAEETHPAIIEAETFKAAKARLDEIAAMTAQRSRPTRSAFSGIITCGQCGGKYKRIKNHKFHAWNCAAYSMKGTAACPGLQIREDVLQRAAADALGLNAYDEEVFRTRIASVVARADHVLVFRFLDGHTAEIKWENRSRRDSWTPEMKQAARERTLQIINTQNKGGYLCRE